MKTLFKLIEKVKNPLTDSMSDKRIGKNTVYSFKNIVISKLLLHFSQKKSCLAFENWYNKLSGPIKKNMNKIFSLDKLPTSNQVKNILDGIDIYRIHNVFTLMLDDIFTKKQFIDNYVTIFEKYNIVLYAIDGTTTISSNSIFCDNCYKMTSKTGVITYQHKLLVSAIVTTKKHIGNIHLFPIPLTPELESQNGKQASEQRGFAKFISLNQNFFKNAKLHHDPVLLFDDLYLHYPQIKLINEQNLYFIGTCRDDSHKFLNEMHLKNSSNSLKLEYKPAKLQNNDDFSLSRPYKIYGKKLNNIKISITWSNNLPIKYEKNPNNNLNINYVRIDIYDPNMKEYTLQKLMIAYNKEKKNLKSCNDNENEIPQELEKKAEESCHSSMAFGTNFNINKDNCMKIVKFGRTRWHIENTSFKVLKNSNLHFDRNFAHGKKSMADLTSIFELLVYNIFVISLLFSYSFRNFIAKFTSMDDALVELLHIISNLVIDDYKQFEIFLDNFDKLYFHLIPIRGPPNDQTDQTDQNDDRDEKREELIAELERIYRLLFPQNDGTKSSFMIIGCTEENSDS